MIYQFHWQDVKTGKSLGVKYQFEVNDSLSNFQKRSKFKQALRSARKEFPIPEDGKTMWLLCTEDSEYFQGVMVTDSLNMKGE